MQAASQTDCLPATSSDSAHPSYCDLKHLRTTFTVLFLSYSSENSFPFFSRRGVVVVWVVVRGRSEREGKRKQAKTAHAPSYSARRQQHLRCLHTEWKLEPEVHAAMIASPHIHSHVLLATRIQKHTHIPPSN